MAEVINPPDYYFPGINFNPAFYAEDAGGLSLSQANALYLRKTVPDTATAQETFASGIITPAINSTGGLNIVVPTALSTDVLNVAVGNRTISGQIHHYSDGDNCVAGAGVHINNGSNNGSATNIMNGTTTTGTVNIMTGASSTGTINIGQRTLGINTTTNINGITNISTTGGAVNIGSLNTVTISGITNINTNSTGAITIGGDLCTTSIQGTLNLNGTGSTSILPIVIGNSTATGTTTLASPNTTISGNLLGYRIRGLTSASILTIGDNMITGASLILGNNGVRTKSNGPFETTYIYSPATNGFLSIATDQTTGGSVEVGTASSTINLNGTVNATGLAGYASLTGANTFSATNTFNNATVGIKADIIQGVATTGTQSLFTTKTAGTLSIATAQVSGNINVGGVGSTTTIKGNGQVDGTLSANTIEGTTATSSTITIGASQTTGQISLGSFTGRSGDINIGNNMESGIIKLANAGSVTSSASIQAGTSNRGTHYYRGASVNICDDGGSVNIGSTSSSVITNNATQIVNNATQIVNNIKLIDNSIIQNVYGNASNASSLSTTFNRKSTNTMTSLGCFTIVMPNGFSNQYFEIIVSGSNQNLGGYSYKGCFSISGTTPSAVTNLYGTGATISFGIVGSNITLSILTGGTNQNFVSTLIGYPTIDINGSFLDYSITAI